jgi:hypothetical protein
MVAPPKTMPDHSSSIPSETGLICLLTLALSGSAMSPNIARLFDRPLQHVVRGYRYILRK